MSHPRSSAIFPHSFILSVQYVTSCFPKMELLPNELLDHVIFYVASSNDTEGNQDATSLVSCCQVSRRFFAAAQPLLYSSIHFELMTDEPRLLLNTFKSNTQLARAVKSVYVQCRAPCSTPMQRINQLRDFLAEALPLLLNLQTLRSDHRVTTVKLVETTLVSSLNQATGLYS